VFFNRAISASENKFLIDAAISLNDLQSQLSNSLEALKHDRKGTNTVKDG